jgi:hypothetical protein
VSLFVNGFIWLAFACTLAAAVGLGVLAVLSWPPGASTGWLIAGCGAAIGFALAAQVLALLRNRGSLRRAVKLPDDEAAALIERKITALEDQERRLELRELRLARHMRIHQQTLDDAAIDLVEAHPSDAELAALVETDRRLMAMIDAESQRAFDRVRENRYAGEQGVDTALILKDLRVFVQDVARLYRPDTEDPLLETDVELLAKSVGSTALHLLVVVDGLPLDLKSYNIASIYRLIRRATAYYGTYKAVRPYLDHGLTALQAARLALGMNPVTVGATWLAGKVTAQGAKAVGERLLEQQALRLLHDFIRVVGFEAAMVYSGTFRHRDANWVFGASLVNLEISRGDDTAGRPDAIAGLCRLALRHEFDRLALLRHLAAGKTVPLDGTRAEVVMTEAERDAVAARLAKHCRSTGVDAQDPGFASWRREAEEQLAARLPLPESPVPVSRLKRLRRAMSRKGRGKRRGERDAGGNA